MTGINNSGGGSVTEIPGKTNYRIIAYCIIRKINSSLITEGLLIYTK